MEVPACSRGHSFVVLSAGFHGTKQGDQEYKRQVLAF